MSSEESLVYVRAAATALGLTLDDARAQRVAVNLERTAAMAQLLDGALLAESDEPAEIYCPKPFHSAPRLDSSL